MDAYSVFSSSSTRRDSSRLDQDLKTIRRYSVTGPEQPETRAASLTASRAPHIGIVGAGIAGLRCADILLQHGFQVTVLEGRHRLGGRLHQERLPPLAGGTAPGPLVDMGPNWIHGTKDNPILDLVRETGTVTSSHDVDEHGAPLTGAVFDPQGALLPLADGEALSTIMWTIVEEAFVHSNEHCSAIDPGESLYDFFVRRLPVHVPDTVPEYEQRRAQVLQVADFWGAFVGSPITRQSLKYFWLEECIEGENLFCAGTYKKVLDRIAQPAVRGAAIRYGQTVTQFVSRRSDGGEDVRRSADTGNIGNTVNVTTEAGDVFAFDEVVCTAPLGWLKRKLDAFEPPLPPRLGQAVASIGYGTLEKVYVSFPEAFWSRPAAGDSDSDENRNGRVVRGFCQWLAPGLYAQPANPRHWSHEAVDLSALPAAVAHPTLLFYIFGDQSQHVTDTLAAEASEEKKTAFLLDYFRPYYGRLPHYDPADPACRPTACLATSWRRDPLAGHGSYSNFQVGLAQGDEDVRVLRRGLPGRGLWLAGEHTAPFVALGTATGAYWSGESVGRRIAEVYGRRRERPKEEAAVELGEHMLAASDKETAANGIAIASSGHDGKAVANGTH